MVVSFDAQFSDLFRIEPGSGPVQFVAMFPDGWGENSARVAGCDDWTFLSAPCEKVVFDSHVDHGALRVVAYCFGYDDLCDSAFGLLHLPNSVSSSAAGCGIRISAFEI